jgi:hypothetical protein
MNLALAAPFGMVDLRGDPRIMPISNTRTLSQVTRCAVHHSGTATGDVFIFQNHWRNVLRWITGGSHFVILRNGFIQWVYDFHVVSNGVGNHNTGIVNVCVVGSGNFAPEQERALDWLLNSHIRPRRPAITIPNILGHREFSGHASNTCPGRNMNVLRARLSGSVAPPQPPTTPPPAGNLFPVGTIVQFQGGTHHASSTASASSGTRTSGRARVTALAPNARNQYHLIGNQGGAGNQNSNVHGWVQASLVQAVATTPPTQSAFRVRVNVDLLNIRAGAGTNHHIAGSITDRGTYTITEVRQGAGSTAGWGRLLSGAGWISLDFATRT